MGVLVLQQKLDFFDLFCCPEVFEDPNLLVKK